MTTALVRPRRNPSIVEQMVGDGLELILVHPATEQALVLNPSAALIWDLCDGSRQPADLVAELLTATQGAPDRAAVQADVEAWLAELERGDFLQMGEG